MASIDNVLDVSPRVQYVAAASQTAFDYPFPIFVDADLIVDVSGTTMALGTDYTVSGAGNDHGGTVTFLVGRTVNQIVTIYRDISIQRTSDFQQNGPWTSAALNDELDRITLIDQQQASLIGRAMRMGPTDQGADSDQILPSKALRIGKFLVFDANGKPTVSVGTGNDTALRTDLAVPGVELIDSSRVKVIDSSRVTPTLASRVSYELIAAEVAALATATNSAYRPGDIRRYGAVSGVDSTTAVQAALNVAVHGGPAVYIPVGSWLISSTLTISSGAGISVVGDSQGSSILVNKIVGNPANPLFLVSSQNDYFLFQDFQILGNNTAGAGGNGHAFAFINPSFPSTLFPAAVILSRVAVNSHIGNGKNSGGGSIPACAVYAFGVTVHAHDNCFYFNNCCGARYEQSQKVHFSECTIDGNVPGAPGLNCLFIDSCENIAFVNGTLNSAGAGNSTDGIIFLAGFATSTLGFVLHSSRAKGGLPAIVNINGSAFCTNRNVVISDNQLEQFTDPGTHTATMIAVGNGNSGVKISGNYMAFGNTFTAAIGVDVTQATSGYVCGGLVIDNNVFDIGSGGTYLACVRFNVGTDRVASPVVRGNTLGPMQGAFTITDGIRLAGNVDNARLENNHFRAGTTGLITNAINVISGAIRWTVLEGNTYDTAGGGTITNQVTNGGGLNIMRNEGGVFSPGDAVSNTAPTNGATLTTASQPFVRCSPAGNVTGLIMQPGTFRGQYCVVQNNSAFTMTFAAAGASNVADGVASAIPSLCARFLIWDANAVQWFRAA